ncbi:MAG: hypothetical protein WD035_05610 [Balneolaceae bacterium]
MVNRIFSEDEVQILIKRAAELEAERSVSGRSRENGLSIDEIKKVASEAGLDPKFIEQAASELDSTLSDVAEKVQVNRDKITTEIWLDHRPDRETMDVLVTELNHIYGTTDELNWWENLWGTHEGKAKVKRTSSTTEWNYKTEVGIYSTRVLLQHRGERFRIRVSKRQIFGMEWDNATHHLYLVLPFAVLFGVVGGVSSSIIFGMEWLGITAGIALSLFSYPLMRHFTKRSVEKHKAEVANTVRQLSELVLQSSNVEKRKSPSAEKNISTFENEIPDTPTVA